MKVEEPSRHIIQHKKEALNSEKLEKEDSWSKPPFGRIGQIIGIIILLGVFFRMCGGPTLELRTELVPIQPSVENFKSLETVPSCNNECVQNTCQGTEYIGCEKSKDGCYKKTEPTIRAGFCEVECTEQSHCKQEHNCVNHKCIQPEPEPIRLSGFGQEATSFFVLYEGLTTFEMEHRGSGNFAIFLINDEGERLELLVNVIGDFHGSKAVHISRTGQYLLDVTADGSWAVNMKQPRPSMAPKTNQFSGTGQKYVGPFYLNKGLARFEMNHIGASNFAVFLLDYSGSPVELLVNEMDAFQGSKAVGIDQSGIYYLDITADGSWRIDIS